ncbi:MAG TPA: hypothetical protein VF168_05020 [Trueperaceae bacterium]
MSASRNRVETGQRDRREVLAGNRGRCSDYQTTSLFGREREPFTWLSDGGPTEDSSLENLLHEYMSGSAIVRFEALELQDEDWAVQLSGNVRILYVEFDGRISKVRALLQWVPEEAPSRT